MTLTTASPPPAGIYWQAVVLASMGLSVDPALNFRQVPEASMNLRVSPQISMLTPQNFGLHVSPTFGIVGGSRQAGEFDLSVSPGISWIPSTAFEMDVSPSFGMTASTREAASVHVGVTPGFSPAASGISPVSYDSTGAGAGVSGTTAATLSWAHTITGNAVVVALTMQSNLSTTTATAKVGTTSMTKLGNSAQFTNGSGYFVSVVLFGLLSPPTGSQTVSVTMNSGTNYCVANSVSYKNVSSFGSVVSNTGASSVPALSVPSGTGQMVTEAFTTWSTNPSGYTQTSRYSQNVNAFGGASRGFLIGDAPGASTVNFSAASSDQWAAIAVPMNHS